MLLISASKACSACINLYVFCHAHVFDDNECRGVNERDVRARNKRAQRTRNLLLKRIYTKMSGILEEWRNGFEVMDPSSNCIYLVKIIVAHCIFDLPAMSEATGLVCIHSCMHAGLCVRLMLIFLCLRAS